MSWLRHSALFLSTCAAAATLVGCAATPVAGPNAAATVPLPRSAPLTTPTLGREVGAVVNDQVVIDFPYGGAALSAQADRKLDLASRLFRDANPIAMFSTGYSDRTGDEYRNLLLSARRAEAVKRGLVARGLPEQRLLIQALGESELADAHDPASAKNRRVVITWRLF